MRRSVRGVYTNKSTQMVSRALLRTAAQHEMHALDEELFTKVCTSCSAICGNGEEREEDSLTEYVIKISRPLNHILVSAVLFTLNTCEKFRKYGGEEERKGDARAHQE